MRDQVYSEIHPKDTLGLMACESQDTCVANALGTKMFACKYFFFLLHFWVCYIVVDGP